jgi:ligand-binding sensor domain-containing protein/signal transduction histidine kinase
MAKSIYFPFRATVCVALALLLRAGAGAAEIQLLSLPQLPIIRTWDTGAGLPQNTVNAIVQTRDGYLWLATDDGLARFDGVHFKTFGREQGLPSVDISSLFEDHQGVLWIGTSGYGLCRLNQGMVEIISGASRQPGSDTINCLQEDRTGRLWVGTVGGLNFYRDGQVVEDSAFDILRHASILSLLQSRDGTTMWISSSADGLFEWKNGQLTPCIGPAGHEKMIAECLLEDRQGRLWVGVGNGVLLCHERDAWKIFDEKNGVPFAFVSCMTEDASGTIWAGSLDAGLYRFDGNRFHVLRQADGLSADNIRSLLCDREGILWIGTRTGGLDRLNRRKLIVAGAAQGLTNDFTRSVAEAPDGTLWVATVGGSLYYGNQVEFKAFRPTNENRVYYYATVYSLLIAPDSSLWWGSHFGLLHWKDNQLADCITNEPWIRNASVTALQNDGHGGMWIGTTAGHLEHWQNGRIQEFPNHITRTTITTLAVPTNGTLWVGTEASGLKWIDENGTVHAITNGLSGKSSIRTLYLDDKDCLWIGTGGGGLSCCRNGRVVSFSASQGIPPRTVSQIVEDDHKFLWLGCSHGIFKVCKQDLLDCADGKLASVHCQSFGIDDGMLSEECSGGFCPAGLKTRSGLICFSTVKGLVFVNPNEPATASPGPKALLEEVLVGGHPQAIDARASEATNAPTTASLTIAPGERDVELRFTAIDFSAPEKIGFRYRLEPIDKDWTKAGDRRTVYYPHLAPGNFVFHVQACNANGSWSEQDTKVALAVLPFFWETAWFHAAVWLAGVVFFAGILWLRLRRRYRLRVARLQAINAIERERLRISKDIHDQVGGVLTQVSQLTDMGLNETGDEALVKKRFERIGDRARVAVQSLDEIVWATNPKNDNLASFAEYVSRYSDEFFEYTSIRCWQEMPTALAALPLRADVRHNVFLAIREAFHNVLKHSKATEVWLKMSFNNEQATVKIEDNGCGFEPAQPRAGGNGLGNMQARLEESGGTAVCLSTPGKGTTIIFTFPVKRLEN